MRKLSLVVLAMSFFLVACGGDDVPGVIDGPPTPDTAPLGCILQSAYADLTLGTQGAPAAFAGQVTGGGDFAVGVIGTVTPGPPAEGLLIVLLENAGAFTGGFANGVGTTDPIDSGASCGGCLEGYGGYTMSTADALQYYIAQSGALTMTVADPAVSGNTGRYEGVFNNVSMIGFDAATDVELSPPCTTTVNNLSFVWDVTWP